MHYSIVNYLAHLGIETQPALKSTLMLFSPQVLILHLLSFSNNIVLKLLYLIV